MRSLLSNECMVCGVYTTAEGAMCRTHWDRVRGGTKSLYHVFREVMTKEATEEKLDALDPE